MGQAAENPVPQVPLPVHSAPPIVPNHVLARMVERVTLIHPRSSAEALRELRTAFPETPLALRVTALGLAKQQQVSPDRLEIAR
jgi:hypothetical protein